MPKLYSLEFRQEAVRLLRTSGRPVKQLASELGISPQTLRNWASQLAVDGAAAPGLSSNERDELRRLRREVRVLTEEREILKKAAAFFAQEGGARLIFRFIAAKRAEHSISIMCRVLEVSRSGYHAWTRRPRRRGRSRTRG